MRCQYCDERKAIMKINYMNKENPQYAWVCSDCAENFITELKEKE